MWSLSEIIPLPEDLKNITILSYHNYSCLIIPSRLNAKVVDLVIVRFSIRNSMGHHISFQTNIGIVYRKFYPIFKHKDQI